MWATARTLHILGKYLLLCIGKPLHPWLGMYVSRVNRELGLAGCRRSEPNRTRPLQVTPLPPPSARRLPERVVPLSCTKSQLNSDRLSN